MAWFRAKTVSGKDAGLAFECPTCRIAHTHDAPARIFHCGQWEEKPLLTALLPVRQIQPTLTFGDSSNAFSAEDVQYVMSKVF